MIDDLEKREKFWGTRDQCGYEGASVPAFTKYQLAFSGKAVLEIGPGEGRQFTVLAPEAKCYYVADISVAVLEKPAFKTATGHFLITSYDGDFRAFGPSFDIVHCWYVVHHLRHAELEPFFQFVHRHLVAGGFFYFNMPNNHPDAVSDDGIGTTPHDIAVALKSLTNLGFEIVDVDPINFESLNIVARR